MKHYIQIITILLAASCLFGCRPQEETLPELVPNTNSSMVSLLNPRVEADENDPNTMIFIMDEVEGMVGVWNIGGKLYPKSKVIRYYDFAGDYQVQAFAYDNNGPCPAISVSFHVESTDPEVCSNVDYADLTGGCEKPEGKTWVLDSSTKGYYGLGAVDSSEPDWWPADPGSHNGVYDDELTFVLNADKTFKHETNGTSGLDSEEIDFPAYTATWDLYESNGVQYIDLTGNGFFPPRSSDTQGVQSYVLLELTENILRVKVLAGTSQAWYYRFVPKQ